MLESSTELNPSRFTGKVQDYVDRHWDWTCHSNFTFIPGYLIEAFLVILLLLLQTERSCGVRSQFQCHEKLNLHRNDTFEIVQTAFYWIGSCISNSHKLIFISSKAANSLLRGSVGLSIGTISCCCGGPSVAEHRIYFRDKH